MFRDILIVAAVLLAMIAAVVGVVAGNLHRMVKSQNDVAQLNAPATGPAASEPAAPATAPATVEAVNEDPPAAPSTIDLPAIDATIHGNLQLADGPARWNGRKNRGGDFGRSRPPRHLTGFSAGQDFAQWTCQVPTAGEYEVNVNYGCTVAQIGHFVLAIDGKEIPFTTEGERYDTLFHLAAIGRLTLPAGKATIIFRATPESWEHPFLNLREIQLIPTF